MLYTSLLHFLSSCLECLFFALDFIPEDDLLCRAGTAFFGASHRYCRSLLAILDRQHIGVETRLAHGSAESQINVVSRSDVSGRDLDFARGLLLARLLDLSDGLEQLS